MANDSKFINENEEFLTQISASEKQKITNKEKVPQKLHRELLEDVLSKVDFIVVNIVTILIIIIVIFIHLRYRIRRMTRIC